jgi:hypothetical protein
VEEDEKWIGWNDGRNAITGYGCPILIEMGDLFSYDREVKKRHG